MKFIIFTFILYHKKSIKFNTFLIITANIVKKDEGKYQLQLQVKREKKEKNNNLYNKAIDINVANNETFFINNVTTNETKIIDYKKHRRKLQKINKQINNIHKIPAANRNKKQKIKLQKLYSKEKNILLDFIRKSVKNIIKDGNTIVIEDLNSFNMRVDGKQFRKINHAYREVRFGEIIKTFERNGEKNNFKLIKVNPKNTSKTCSKCLTINTELKVGEKEWKCSNCNTKHNRDLNATYNIARLGKII